MRTFLPILPLVLLGCAGTTSYVHSDNTTLGRVVVYRNGVAYFERTAVVDSDVLRLAVPGDKIDDFLKSLTVVDLGTGQPGAVDFPSAAPTGPDALTQMEIHLGGARPHRLKLTYVTEAPSWKPSYRVVLAKQGKVDFQGWAVVDNTSGEDWQNVKLGVGSSSALSFRFDLRSVRMVRRETLQSSDLFAQAPPMGGATFNQAQATPALAPRVFGELSDSAIARSEMPIAASAERKPKPSAVGKREEHRGGPPPAPASPPSMTKSADGAPHAAAGSVGGVAAPRPAAAEPDVVRLAQSLRNTNRPIVVEGYADASDKDKAAASLDRANRVREQLVRNGVDPARVVALAQGEQAGRKAGVRIVEGNAPGPTQTGERGADAKAAPPESLDPIGTSHFESPAAMSIARGTSAMISIFNTSAEGEVVYLFDPESPRGSSSFAFRAVRIKNPTDSVLESGPVSVFGEGRFIGEGLSEPIPARSTAFVPFALDRQIAVEQKDAERDEISRILAVQRGVLSTEVQHIKRLAFTFHNRMGEAATVYVRHTVAPGFKLLEPAKPAEKIGGASLFRLIAAPHASAELAISEASPVVRTIDIRSPADMEAVRVYLRSDRAAEPLKSQLESLSKERIRPV